jgi:hypothetical protein
MAAFLLSAAAARFRNQNLMDISGPTFKIKTVLYEPSAAKET